MYVRKNKLWFIQTSYIKKKKIYSGTKCVDMDKPMKKCVYIYIYCTVKTN